MTNSKEKIPPDLPVTIGAGAGSYLLNREYFRDTVKVSEIKTSDHFRTLWGIVKNEGLPKRLWLDGLVRAFNLDRKMTYYRLDNRLGGLLSCTADGISFARIPPLDDAPHFRYRNAIRYGE